MFVWALIASVMWMVTEERRVRAVKDGDLRVKVGRKISSNVEAARDEAQEYSMNLQARAALVMVILAGPPEEEEDDDV